MFFVNLQVYIIIGPRAIRCRVCYPTLVDWLIEKFNEKKLQSGSTDS